MIQSVTRRAAQVERLGFCWAGSAKNVKPPMNPAAFKGDGGKQGQEKKRAGAYTEQASQVQ
jgi:hypothetical protein